MPTALVTDYEPTGQYLQDEIPTTPVPAQQSVHQPTQGPPSAVFAVPSRHVSAQPPGRGTGSRNDLPRRRKKNLGEDQQETTQTVETTQQVEHLGSAGALPPYQPMSTSQNNWSPSHAFNYGSYYGRAPPYGGPPTAVWGLPGPVPQPWQLSPYALYPLDPRNQPLLTPMQYTPVGHTGYNQAFQQQIQTYNSAGQMVSFTGQSPPRGCEKCGFLDKYGEDCFCRDMFPSED